MSHLTKLSSPYGRIVSDPSGQECYQVENPQLFVQAAGYLKYVFAKDGPCVVAMRGQSELYPSLTPALYRGVTTEKAKEKRDRGLRTYLESLRSRGEVLRAVGTAVHEPLLQHYGIRTKWLDLVDNMWVALWFACHDARSTGRHGEYLHFERRVPRNSGDYAYVLLLRAATTTPDKDCPGLWVGKGVGLIDLRIAAPSHFVRPHAQHGLLLARTKGLNLGGVNYSDFVVGVIRVRLEDALSWLGDGTLLTTHALFPPAMYDYGYRELLTSAPGGNGTIGAIQHIGA